VRPRPRLTIRLLEKTRAPAEVGTVEFYRIAVITADDFKCIPSGLLTNKQAQQVAADWQRGATSGDVGDLEWHDHR
jgi:hypothetical protein